VRLKLNSVLIDTNLLLLLIIGLFDKKIISSHKRTKIFVPEDFDLLISTINGYDMLWVTSHCFAETSNLLRQTNAKTATDLMNFFSTLVSRNIAKIRESHIPINIIMGNNILPRLGITDTGILIKAKQVSLVLTVDLYLYLEISNKGYKALNFNYLRQEKYLK